MATTLSPLALMVRKLETHAVLDDGDRKALLALPYTLRTFEPSSYLVREGDAPDQCAVLLSGFAYRQKLTGAGMRQIVSLHIPGEPLDFQHLLSATRSSSIRWSRDRSSANGFSTSVAAMRGHGWRISCANSRSGSTCRG
jgi:CRP-like cAMP-binding protein